MATLDLGGGYGIDLADADKFIKALQDTKDRLDSTLGTTARDLQVRPPGNDDYSAVVANTYNDVVRQHQGWNLKKQAELEDLIVRITAAVAGYRQAEHDNTLKG
jgi:hypothetical protein